LRAEKKRIGEIKENKVEIERLQTSLLRNQEILKKLDMVTKKLI
jgi:hypothetical protein